MSFSLFPGGGIVAGGVTKPTGLWQGEHAQNLSKDTIFLSTVLRSFFKIHI
jgi:hypothetical protein